MTGQTKASVIPSSVVGIEHGCSDVVYSLCDQNYKVLSVILK